ncbi:cytochrome oxidase biogenesis protein Surf1, facilitates heme A insertion [Arthrobacter pityocampae]|uniref:SURF1-like protein n=1 Tax=Arthrobacter pityocampae TaxID=547334 RepID=A0A2S5IZQ6_9MICC|nr:SURF1 family protein [Arthrobacter pityocampae]PPB50011.1 cytochrome oxidase biogenesis protein Surf1, facilitates heme A insertion [Arthrobacter pityocampae]
MFRYFFSARWLGWLAMVVVLAAGCVGLGRWQLERREAVVEDIQRIEANYDAPPERYVPGVNGFDAFDPAREWTPVTFTGTYDVDQQVVVRNRPLNGQPGYEVLTPLRLEDGTAVIIDRGWLPIGNVEAGRPDTVPAPPAGTVEVTARIRPGEPEVNRGAPEGQVASVHLPALAERLEYPLQDAAYGLLALERPAAAETPVAAPKPSIDEGPHLSYSLQWFAFGVLAFVGLGYAARQQRRSDAERDGTAPDRPVRRRRHPSAEEEEDAILDARGMR